MAANDACVRQARNHFSACFSVTTKVQLKCVWGTSYQKLSAIVSVDQISGYFPSYKLRCDRTLGVTEASLRCEHFGRWSAHFEPKALHFDTVYIEVLYILKN